MPINSFLYPGAKTTPAYQVANSCRFDKAGTAYMHKSQGTPSSRRTFTYSGWIKLGLQNIYQIIFESADGSHNFQIVIQDDGNNNDLRIYDYDGSTNLDLRTSQIFRDFSAWYHVCVAIDTTQGTASNRAKLYINGTQVTAFDTATYPDQNYDTAFVANKNIQVGRQQSGSDYFDGYMAEVCFIDGLALTPTSFGEFDEDSPRIFKPIDVSGLTFGNNGFYLDFEDSSNLGNDKNGGTDLTEVNLAATDQCQDSPTNNFAVINPLNVNSGGVPTFAEGNLDVTVNGGSGTQWGGASTIGVTAGKWYAECKIKVVDNTVVGVDAAASKNAEDDVFPGQQNESVGILVSNGNKYIDDSGATHGAALSADDILMIALDLTNENVYFGKNGQWFDGSGNADEASPNSAIGLEGADHSSAKDGAYFFAFGDSGGSSAGRVQWNFGCPPYANSSDAADENGYGAFEYAPPSGYLALCTKNLGSDGG